MMPTVPTSKPVPTPTPTTQPFWDGTAEHKLRIQRCVTTGRVFTYPRRFSPYVVGGAVEWIDASGLGTLYSYVINHVPAEGYRDEVPYVVALIELAEGPRVLTNLVEVEPRPERLPIGMAVEATYEPRQHLTVLQFRPATPA